MSKKICIECGADTRISKTFPGSIRKKKLVRYSCTNSLCNFEETVEAANDEDDNPIERYADYRKSKDQAKILPDEDSYQREDI